MPHLLSPGQRALLQQLLQMRLHELERRAALRADQGSGDLEVARLDQERTETAAVRTALARIHDATFGQCIDCALPMAFARLKLEPWALRCAACAAAHERRSAAVTSRPRP